ncbi:MAG: UbiD family decarboxylase [Pseudomonadota bacterium]|nr:UbiD family decarboxylase [Pseudomonadota bacterium]
MADSSGRNWDQDLRHWMEAVEAEGALKTITGAETTEEIGGILDLYQRQMGNPAILFDEVPGFPTGHRVLANVLTSVARINIALGLPADGSELDLVLWWRDYMKNAPKCAPEVVTTGALHENVIEGDAIDITSIPTPTWHEHDGGPFIGTGCMVVMKDPDTGWVNYGAYRVQTHGPKTASVMMSPGRHGRLIMDKYHSRGEPCPVAVVAGMHPTLLMIAGLEIPQGVSEYDAVGGIFGEPVRTLEMPRTGIPVPANAEIAFEGFIMKDDLIEEGPLGEWTGYYAGGKRRQPAIRIETFMHRDDPVLLGVIPAVPPNDNTYYLGSYRSGAVWNQLEAAGIPDIQGVCAHEAGGSRLWLTVSIKQRYGGHSKQAGLIASQCYAGGYTNRWVVVVDDDIDPTNTNDVLWAMCTRFDPRIDLERLDGCWSTSLDPMCYDSDTDKRNSRVVIDACRPWDRMDDFPTVARSSRELDDRIREKWAHVLPGGV